MHAILRVGRAWVAGAVVSGGAFALDADELHAWLDPSPSRFTLDADAEAAIEMPRANAAASEWYHASAVTPIACGRFGETIAEVDGTEIDGLEAGAPAGPLLLQRGEASLTARYLGDGRAICGLNAAISESRTGSHKAWRTDMSVAMFVGLPLSPSNTLVGLASYDTWGMWFDAPFLPGLADLIIVDDRWWALVGLPCFVHWRPLAWLSVEGGFVDSFAADATARFSPSWSASIDYTWRQEVFRDSPRHLAVVDEMRITLGPTVTVNSACEASGLIGFAFARRLVLDTANIFSHGQGASLPNALIAGITLFVAF